MAALGAPREPQLSSMLATLQPDQYELVTQPGWLPMVVQGNPGTGKTIIAAHRAAFLVSRERKAQRLQRVLLVGPTRGYRTHVAGIIAELVDDKEVYVAPLGDLLAQLRGVKTALVGGTEGHFLDFDSKIADILDRTAKRLSETDPRFSGRPSTDRLRRVYECLRANAVAGEEVIYDRELAARVGDYPSFDVAVRKRRWVPVLAACAVSLGPPRSAQFDHIIVDEAQDVRPLEWEILRRLNAGDGWTILGDVYQRRWDHSFREWQSLIELLDLQAGATLINPIECQRGYRSTKQIMQFANQLLPADGRRTNSLQLDGPPVVVKRVTQQALAQASVEHATRLLAANNSGTVAIITVDAAQIAKYLATHGWTRTNRSSPEWFKEGRLLSVLDSEDSRGLEFDGVVVVEPAAFPTNLGIRGQLYTSLTRANRELVVVHSRGLPDRMRSR